MLEILNKKIGFVPAMAIILLCSFAAGSIVVLMTLQIDDIFKINSFDERILNQDQKQNGSKACFIDQDCVVFGKTGDCNCGCYNKDNLPSDAGGACFCQAPVSCECIEEKCEPVFQSETSCLEKYPQINYAGCVPGEILDGFTVIYLYPDSFDFSGPEYQYDMPSPTEEVENASVAFYSDSESACETFWHIKVEGEWQKVDQGVFCDFLDSYCDDCLLEWVGGCC